MRFVAKELNWLIMWPSKGQVQSPQIYIVFEGAHCQSVEIIIALDSYGRKDTYGQIKRQTRLISSIINIKQQLKFIFYS